MWLIYKLGIRSFPPFFEILPLAVFIGTAKDIFLANTLAAAVSEYSLAYLLISTIYLVIP